jgi:hypothetical protein
VNVAYQLFTHSSVDQDHYFMTNWTADDYGEWLHLAEEAFRTMAEDGHVELDPLRWR